MISVQRTKISWFQKKWTAILITFLGSFPFGYLDSGEHKEREGRAWSPGSANFHTILLYARSADTDSIQGYSNIELLTSFFLSFTANRPSNLHCCAAEYIKAEHLLETVSAVSCVSGKFAAAIKCLIRSLNFS